MHSRAYLLLEREYQQLQEAALHGISVIPRTGSLLEWVAEIRGLKDSLWEGCVLQLYMKYPENYNYLPPEIVFNTIPYHPNVDQLSGKPCILFLDDPEEWNPRYTMSTILLTVQVMLSDPQAETAVNLEAADMWQNRPSMYRQLVLDCVKNSKLIDAGVIYKPPRISITQDLPFPSSDRTIKPVSFEDYHRNWTEIGTSKAMEDSKRIKYEGHSRETQSNRAIGDMKLSKICSSSILSSFNNSTPSPQISVQRGSPECIMCRLSEMNYRDPKAQLWVTEPDMDRDPNYQVGTSHPDTGHSAEPLEEEVENLVEWTNTLKIDLLED